MSVNCCGLGGKRRRNAKISLMAAVRPEWQATSDRVAWPPATQSVARVRRLANGSFLGIGELGPALTHSFALLHGWRCHPHERGSEECAGGAELPVEFGKAGASAGMASVG